MGKGGKRNSGYLSMSQNRKEFSEGSTDANNRTNDHTGGASSKDGIADDEHTKLIKSLPSFKTGSASRRGLS